MKIRILSDIHLEFGNLRCRQGVEDLVVLAGDIGKGAMGMPWARMSFPDKPIVYVAGNHEFYGRDINEGYDRLAKSALKHEITFLQDSSTVINGTRFIGATLWTDFDLFGNGPLDAEICRRGMNDFRLIKDGNAPLSTDRWLSMHSASRAFINEALQSSFEPKVIVTHHLPSLISVPKRYKEDRLSAAYASRLDNLVHDSNAKLWIHGHTHDTVDYTLGNTRVVANPRGYVGYELNPNFDPNFIIEI